MKIYDVVSGQEVTAAELRADIALLENLAAASLDERLEELYLEIIWQRGQLLAQLEDDK